MKLFEYFSDLFTNKIDSKFEDESSKEDDILLPNIEDQETPLVNGDTLLHNIEFDVRFNNIKDAILTYRQLSNDSIIEQAIDEITNDAIVSDNDNVNIVSLNLDNIEDSLVAKNTKNKIIEEFEKLLGLLNFSRYGSSLFRKWYVDGRLWFQCLFSKNTKDGIKKIRLLSPLDIKQFKDKKTNQIFYIYKQDERSRICNYSYSYDRIDMEFSNAQQIPEKDIVFVPSGLIDPLNHYFISYLQKSIKPYNVLRHIEDSAVIYRITRSPERRVFYIDVGKLSPTKSRQYIEKLMRTLKSDISYDPQTGNIKQTSATMTMLQDFFLPSRADQKGTKVETLQGGSQLGEIDDIVLFKKNLLKSLKVPPSRFDDENRPMVEIGRSGELSRIELTFGKFIQRLRMDFSILFLELLKRQLIVKNIINLDDWKKIKNLIKFKWESDLYFTELKDQEILKERLGLLDDISAHIGEYYSVDWVKKNVLKQSDEEIEEMNSQIEKEKKSGEIKQEEPEE